MRNLPDEPTKMKTSWRTVQAMWYAWSRGWLFDQRPCPNSICAVVQATCVTLWTERKLCPHQPAFDHISVVRATWSATTVVSQRSVYTSVAQSRKKLQCPPTQVPHLPL